MLSKTWKIALAFVLVLAACGGSDDDATANDGDQMEEMATTEESMADEESMSDDMSDEESMADDMSDEESMSDDMADEESMSDDMSDEESMSDDMSDEDSEHMSTTFTVTISNTSDSIEFATPLAPGAFAVHSSMDTLFAQGQEDRGEGLEALAEDGDPSGLVAALAAQPTVSVAGAFTTPDGAAEPGPALPGASYSFTFEAIPGDYLSFATMFVQSNDWFFATDSAGLNLFEGDAPVAGDITPSVGLWDAGTEVDETPGEGANQAPRQAGPNTGDVQGAPIVAVPGYDGAITVTITPAG